MSRALAENMIWFAWSASKTESKKTKEDVLKECIIKDYGIKAGIIFDGDVNLTLEWDDIGVVYQNNTDDQSWRQTFPTLSGLYATASKATVDIDSFNIKHKDKLEKFNSGFSELKDLLDKLEELQPKVFESSNDIYTTAAKELFGTTLKELHDSGICFRVEGKLYCVPV